MITLTTLPASSAPTPDLMAVLAAVRATPACTGHGVLRDGVAGGAECADRAAAELGAEGLGPPRPSMGRGWGGVGSLAVSMGPRGQLFDLAFCAI